MTNAEKYLKDDVDIQKLAQELEQTIYRRTSENLSKVFVDFFNKKISALTEDERVILRNIDKRYKLICKDNAYNLFVKNGMYDLEMINPLNKLFQFIKPRRRISNRGVVK